MYLFFPQMNKMSRDVLGQSQELEFQLVSRGLNICAITYCFPRCISWTLDWMQSMQNHTQAVPWYGVLMLEPAR